MTFNDVFHTRQFYNLIAVILNCLHTTFTIPGVVSLESSVLAPIH